MRISLSRISREITLILPHLHNTTAELEKMQNSVAKSVQVETWHGVWVNSSRRDSSLKIKGCSEKATFADYVNGISWLFPSGKSCGADHGIENVSVSFRIPHEHICTAPIHGVQPLLLRHCGRGKL